MKKIINGKEYNVLDKRNHPQPIQEHITWGDFSTFTPKDGTKEIVIWPQRVEERLPDWILNKLK